MLADSTHSANGIRHILYNVSMMDGKIPIEDFRITMSRKIPSTVCGPYAWSVVYFCTMAGMKDVVKAEGAIRGDVEDSTYFEHSWCQGRLPFGGALIFTDTSNGRLRLDLARVRDGNTFSPYCVPIESWAQGFFLYNYHPSTVIAGAPQQGDIQPTYLLKAAQNPKENDPDFNLKVQWIDWIRWAAPVRGMRDVKNFFGTDMLSAAVN